MCNNKLIGGHPFLATYLSDPGRAAAEPFHTARDSNGHGTHTSSTTAGNMLDSAMIFGVERGPIHGIAPGAHLIEYKVCGIQGCFDSDTAAAVQQAILDGVDVINFSISGGTDPFTDPTELAFLDAYAAGVFVSASAGNEGPGAGTANHLSPWVTTVGASTQTREFQSTLTVTAGGDTPSSPGRRSPPGSARCPSCCRRRRRTADALCDAPAAPGSFDRKDRRLRTGRARPGGEGLQRPPGRCRRDGAVQPGAGRRGDRQPLAAHRPSRRRHRPGGVPQANPGATASFTGGVATDGQGDVMAAFSSRGPGGLFIKPDVTAPGVQILAGHTPMPESRSVEGPPGEFFQAIAGTSMSSPHNAGAAILMMASHPDWTPGQVKSALMTTATEDVVKEDLVTPADPLDFGSGRIVIDAAAATGLTMDETAANFAAMAADPLTAIHLNIPSINAPLLAGSIGTSRTLLNSSSGTVRYAVSTEAPAGPPSR